MIEDGTIAEDERVELIEGLLVAKSRRNRPYIVAGNKGLRILWRMIPPGWHVAKGVPIQASDWSRPEPDLAVIRGVVEPGRFQNKFVLVGATAPGLLDNFPTPVSGAPGMPNVEIDANILDAILHHRLVRVVPPVVGVALSLALLWVSFFELLWSKPMQTALQPVGSLVIVVGAVLNWAPIKSAFAGEAAF